MTYRVCPAQPLLPVYSIFAGVSCIVMSVYGMIITFIERRKKSAKEGKLSPLLFTQLSSPWLSLQKKTLTQMGVSNDWCISVFKVTN